LHQIGVCRCRLLVQRQRSTCSYTCSRRAFTPATRTAKKSACPGRRRHVARVNNVATTCSTTCVSTCCASLLCRRVFVVAEEYVEVVTAAANRTCRTLTDDLRLLSDGSEPRCQIVNTLRDDLVAAMLHSDQVDIHKTVERSHNTLSMCN